MKMKKDQIIWDDFKSLQGGSSIKRFGFWKVLRKKKFWKIVKVIITTICLISSCIVVGINYQSIAAFLFTSVNPNGELAKVLLSVFGGIGLFYGLWLNSKRIKEQTRQNCISENSNSDKRFSEAIGYLGSENTSIVLGGIYALYQLAKEDVRYRTIVAGLFTSYLEDKSKSIYNKFNELGDENNIKEMRELVIPITFKTIFEILFNEDNIFKNIKVNFSNTLFINIYTESSINNCNFEGCILLDCTFTGDIINCYFSNSHIIFSYFGGIFSKVDNCEFFDSHIDQTNFRGESLTLINLLFTSIKNSSFEARVLSNCFFEEAEILGIIKFKNIQSFPETRFNKKDKVKLEFNSCKNLREIRYIN